MLFPRENNGATRPAGFPGETHRCRIGLQLLHTTGALPIPVSPGKLPRPLPPFEVP